MTYALVLGAGGVTGIAWETGLLKGLRDAGLDLTGADLVVGTSAGSVVGAQVTTGVPLDELYRRQVEPLRGGERTPDLGRLMEFFAARASPDGPPAARPTREMLAWIGAQARAASTKVTEAGRLQVIKARLPVHEWPERALAVTAVDTADGAFVAWRRSSGVPLPLAVASSCAVPWVYPPTTIRGRRYMDGGVRSTTNADLATGHGLVLIVAPIAGVGRATVGDEADELRRAGARVEVLVPDAAAVESIGPNPLDPARRAQAAEAGLAQAPAAAEALAGVRAMLSA
ncbi:MAG TPA: patatin-like phospholipase family protein [Terriglobales bacterium]|nr:patatin-like phospholipase family protein [Terriglobales bacterium]